MTEPGSERIRGVSHALPDGEHVRWEGAPSGRLLGVHTLHMRLLAGYFALILGAWAIRFGSNLGMAQSRELFVSQIVLYALVLAGAAVFALLTSRMTTYAVTDRRVVLQVGIAFPMTINIPFAVVDTVSVRRFADGSGQIALELSGTDRIAYLALWPHARAWHFRVPQPLLRGLAEPDVVGRALQEALVAYNAQPAQAATHVASTRMAAAHASEKDPSLPTHAALA